MLSVIDSISEMCAKIAAWLFFLIGCVIVFEVVARYVFLAPTVWGEEMSRFLQIWATYLAAAYVLHQRKLIAIDVVVSRMPKFFRITCESCALLVIIVFSLTAFIYGLDITIESIRIGRATSTMLAVPKWMTEVVIPIGFGLLTLQAFAELIRTITSSRSSGSPLH